MINTYISQVSIEQWTTPSFASETYLLPGVSDRDPCIIWGKILTLFKTYFFTGPPEYIFNKVITKITMLEVWKRFLLKFKSIGNVKELFKMNTHRIVAVKSTFKCVKVWNKMLKSLRKYLNLIIALK